MRPRRPFRPRFPRPSPRFGPPPPNKRVPPLLMKANRLFEQEKYEEAARLFEDLAEKAAARKIPPAAHLFIRGGTAYMMGENFESAVSLFVKGFDLFAGQKRWRELQRVSDRVIDDLRQKKRENEASELENWVKNNLVEVETAMADKSTLTGGYRKKKTQLPLKCPSCGASVHPDEVEWVDENTAECNYCGNIMRGE